MPNFINPDAARVYAEAVAGGVGLTSDVHNQYVSIVAKFLLRSDECAMPISAPAPRLPAWAQVDIAEGREVHRFRPPGSVTADRLRKAARSLAIVPKIVSPEPEFAKRISALTATLPRLSFDALESRIQALLAEARSVCRRRAYVAARRDRAAVPTTEGRWWGQVESFAMLDETGRALNNCLRESSEHHQSYWDAFERGEVDFWRLVGADATVLAVVELRAGVVHDAKGVNNSRLFEYADDLVILTRELGLDAESSDDVIDLGIVLPAWASRRRPDWQGDYGERAVSLWLGPERAVLAIGKENPRYIQLDLINAARWAADDSPDLSWSCRGLDGAGWPPEQLADFLTRYLVQVAPRMAKRLFSIYVLAAADGMLR